MPFDRPTLPELISRAEGDFESRLPGADARLPMSNINVIARVGAGGLHGLYGYQDWIARQIPFDTADGDVLERWAAIWGIYRKPSSFAVGSVVFAGLDGTPIPAGTEGQRADGVSYVTTADVTMASGAATAPAKAVLAGLAGNTAAATKLKVVSTIGGVASDVMASDGGMTGGADVETDASLLARLLARIRQAPHGGAKHDYVSRALEVPGVTRAWVMPEWMGLGTVGITFVCDDQAGGIIPNADKVAQVQAHMDAEDFRPVTAEVIAFSPTAKAINPVIAGLNPSTPAVKADVVAQLADLLRREANPGATILLSHLREAVSLAVGEIDHTITTPAGNFACLPHEIATLGVPVWA